MTKRDIILKAEIKKMLEYVQRGQAPNCYSDETMELQRNLRCLMLELEGQLAADLRELSGYTMGSAYYDGFIRGIRAGISLANTINEL